MGRAKVLVVDDQLGICKLIEEVLDSNKYDVFTLGRSIKAIETIKEFQPDIILLDVKMPEMNGLEVIQAMLEEGVFTDTILMTAYGELEIVEQAKELGVKFSLTKPFDLWEMEKMVENIVAKIPL